MPRVALAKTDRTTITGNGTNLTAIAKTAFATGADNGFEIDYNPDDEYVIDTTVGATVLTIIPTPAQSVTSIGATIGNVTLTLAMSAIHVFKPTPGMVQPGVTPKVFIDSDVAAEIVVLTPAQT